jgi:hypothetical protein
VEHNTLLYEDAERMMECLAQALKQTSREATILLYAPARDPHLQKLSELINLWCSASTVSRPRKGRRRCREPRERGRHTHEVALEARGEVDQAQAGAVSAPESISLETAKLLPSKELLSFILHIRQR